MGLWRIRGSSRCPGIINQLILSLENPAPSSSFLRLSDGVSSSASTFSREKRETVGNIFSSGGLNQRIIRFSGMGFVRSSCYAKKGDFLVENVDEEATSASKRISEDAETVCTILIRDPSLLDQSGVKVSPELVVNVLKRLTNAGKLALTFFKWAEKQQGFQYSTESYHGLIDSLGKIKQFKLIWELLFVMKEQRLLTKETFALICRRYVRAKNIKEAIETFDRMGKFGLTPEVSDFNSFLDTLSKSKNVKTAQEIFIDFRRRFPVDLKTYTILLEGWGTTLNLSKMTAVYKEMMSDGFEPDDVTYGILIRGFVKCRRINDAVNLFDEMILRKLKPGPHIYCTLVNGLGAEKRLTEALKYFELSKASGYPLDIPTYNALIGSYCWVHQFENAYKILSEMKNSKLGPNARSYEVIIHHLVKAKRTEEAYQVFRRMPEESGCEPELNTYTMIVRMFFSERREAMALKVWEEMREKGVIPCMHMYSVLIKGLQRVGRMEEACFYFQEMIERGLRPPARLYGDLKDALVDMGKGELAMHLGNKLEMLRTMSTAGKVNGLV